MPLNRTIPIQFLRSSVNQKRPIPTELASGQPAVNINPNEPGLFLADSTGSELFKVGPCHVGENPPNYDPAPNGFPGNTVGEQWLDTSNSQNPTLYTWNGLSWKSSGSSLTNIIWVDTNGNDDNDGLTVLTPKKTIKAALAIATSGTEVKVSPGEYYEDNPLVFPEAEIALVGWDLRNCTIYLENDADLFHVLNGCYVQNFSFRKEGAVTGKGILAYPPAGAGNITESPYIQNCTNFVEGSIGLDVNGNYATGLKSMVLDSFTQYNPDGIGVKVYNKGYCQVVSMFTICSNISVLAQSGGNVSVTNSNSDFGNYALYADGVGPLEQTGTLLSSDVTRSLFSLAGLTSSQKPYVGQVVTVGELYYNVSEFEILNPGQGYFSQPDVTVSIGTGPEAIEAQGVAIINGLGQISKIEVASSGQNYRLSDVITVTINGGGGILASARAVKNPVYYTINSSTDIVTGSCTISIIENLPYTPAPGDLVNFYRVSRIIANSHCMEYVGSGTNIATCIPANGGVAIQANEVIQANGGRVAITSTDHLGDFRVGEQLVINQTTGTISGEAFSKSILSIVIPYILALS
jgi:hypothetical protein